MQHAPSSSSGLRRRDFLASVSGATLAAPFILGSGSPRANAEPHPGRLKQAVCGGVFKGIKLDLDGMCREAAAAGAVGIDLVGPDAFPTLKKHGLMPTMVGGGSGIKDGINNPANHAAIDRRMREAIKATAEFGAPNVIVLAGDRKGLTDEEGLDHSVAFLNNIKALAEDLGVTLCMELLNSKVNHAGYMCDHTAWGVEVCKRVDSPRVKLLYDIYHMQIMEGDIIRTIRDNIQWIGHFHTAGNPGRHEFDETQELYYPPICKAIADLNFQGYLAHEYTPTKAPLETLRKMMKLCEV
ncbi:MAG: TIM barrel protein [Verrucomicrobiales bacterium]|nr:TIM barrel protein [Verrucomicrobiales bacterium]